jgi:uronate dehydrogenase
LTGRYAALRDGAASSFAIALHSARQRHRTAGNMDSPLQSLLRPDAAALAQSEPAGKPRRETMKTILITGAAGDVAGHLRRELAGKYALRLSDIKPVNKLAPGETFRQGDVARLADMLRVTKGVDAIVHLGGVSSEGAWEDILRVNIAGCYNVFEAARRNGVKRVLFATSNHACGFYRRDQTIDHRVYPKPDSRYGLSKVFGEQLGSLYADKYGLEAFCMRIGNVNPVPVDKRRLSIWISPRDLAQLVQIGVEHADIRFEIVYGVSDNKRSWYDNSNAQRLGYRPQDASEPYAKEVLAKEKPGADPQTEKYQGGTFVLAELGGDPSRPAPRAVKKPVARRPATKQEAAKKKR